LTIEAVLKNIFGGARIVGDKYPGYIFQLDKLAVTEGLSCLIIYRDCRDVTSSSLKEARTTWRDQRFAKRFDTAGKAARQWVDAIESMERHIDQLHVIRYEDLVTAPIQELELLGKWLSVDPGGFPAHIIRDASVGKYKSGLSDNELAAVMEIAGPTMARLGYL
jgi:hypothetical protein